jgi:hypothetical protein
VAENYPGTSPRETGGSTQAGQATEQAKQQGQQLAGQARQQAGELANRGTEQVKSQLANQKHDASQRLTPIQTALRETAEQLRNQGQGSVSQYADTAADQVERFSSYLRETDVDEIMDEARGFARRRPALFLGGAAALGFFGTRFLKSSSSQEQETSAGNVPSTRPTAAVSGATVTHGIQGEPSTALPAGTAVEGDLPTGGQPPTEPDRTEQPPRGSS